LEASQTSETSQQLRAPNAVTIWHDNSQSLLAGFTGRGTPAQAYTSSLIQIAVYDAVVAIRGGYEPFVAAIPAPAGADLDAAIATAAYRVGITRVNVGATRAAFQTAYDNYIRAIPDSQAKSDGIAVGEAAAGAVLAARASDNFYNPSVFANPPSPPPPPPGLWLAVSPANDFATAGASDYQMSFVVPWTAATPDARRAPPPTAMDTGRYASALAEVQRFGRKGITNRSDDMNDAAQFWTETGFSFWQRNVRGIVVDRGLDELESARVLAATGLVAGDAMLACWESKYYYLWWRPWQAIQRADEDGNDRTQPEANWTPEVRANHPEYPSGHGCFGGAMARSLEMLFGDFDVTLSSTGNLVMSWPVVPLRYFPSLEDIVEDTKNARVWAGLHFRTTMNKTAKWIRDVTDDVLCGRFGVTCEQPCDQMHH
jgi:hypothetical protein